MYRYEGLIMTFILHIFCYFNFCGLDLAAEYPEITGFIRGYNWERYRKQRNHVNRIKKQSIKTYFYERGLGGPESIDFWSTIKPFLSRNFQ